MAPPLGLPLPPRDQCAVRLPERRVGLSLWKMEDFDEIRTQAREEWTGTNIQPKFTPTSGQLGMSYKSWSAATAFPGLLG